MKTSEMVNKIFKDRFELTEAQLQPEAKLREDLLLDSMDFIEMIVFIEKSFKIKVDRENLKSISTLGDVYKMVDQTVMGLLNQNE